MTNIMNHPSKDKLLDEAEKVRFIVMTALSESGITNKTMPIALLMGISAAYAQIGVFLNENILVGPSSKEGLTTLLNSISASAVEGVFAVELAEAEVTE